MIVDLSVVIPAFNEVQRIRKTLQAIDRFFQSKEYSYEIIVVDDGSEDGTGNFVLNMQHTIKNLTLLVLPTHQGKGAAVKAGMLSAKGDAVLFMDADGSTSIEEVEKLLPYVSKGFDVIVGSRLIAGAVKKTKQNIFRELLGWLFRRLTHMLIQTNVEDTQNGFKLFSRVAAQKIFRELRTKAWSFDVETLVSAQKHHLKIKEVPIVWTNDGQSNMRFLHMIQMLIDLFRIRRDRKDSQSPKG